MSILEERAVTHDPVLDGPAIAHHGNPFVEAVVSLCGAPVIGVPAPDTAPLCADCARLWAEVFA